MSRKLASIKVISDIRLIDGTDFVCQYRIDGWWVVDKKGQYQIGDTVVYLEIDSWVPASLCPWLVSDKAQKFYNGIEGARLKTVKLRGALSQGLILPISVLDNVEFYPDQDVTECLGIQKWEPSIELSNMTQQGNFPICIPKTDQTRIQSLITELDTWKDESLIWEVTEKYDDSSMTVAYFDGEVHVYSRNFELKFNDTSAYWFATNNQDLVNIIMNHYNETGEEIALQGELCGPKIQGNPYKLSCPRFFMFDIFSITHRRFYSPVERHDFSNKYKIDHVAIIDTDMCFDSAIKFLLKKCV